MAKPLVSSIETRKISDFQDGEEIQIDLRTQDRLYVQLLSEDGERVDVELMIQHDQRSKAEIEIMDGSIVLYT
jgi:hypothetical protein